MVGGSLPATAPGYVLAEAGTAGTHHCAWRVVGHSEHGSQEGEMQRPPLLDLGQQTVALTLGLSWTGLAALCCEPHGPSALLFFSFFFFSFF